MEIQELAGQIAETQSIFGECAMRAITPLREALRKAKPLDRTETDLVAPKQGAVSVVVEVSAKNARALIKIPMAIPP
jgi:hypothetical protein